MTDRRPGKDRIEGKDKAPPCLLHEESLLYKNKYRIPSARLQHWDYGWNAAYFVTICTHNRQCFFGEISNGKMELSEMGKTATIYWMEIPDHFPFVNLGVSTNDVTNGVTNGVTNMNDKNNDPWKPGTLGVIINQYKRKCTIESRKIDPEFAWQSRFHDHIIRNEKSYQNISQYIINNPANWDDDKFNSDIQGGIQ